MDSDEHNSRGSSDEAKLDAVPNNSAIEKTETSSEVRPVTPNEGSLVGATKEKSTIADEVVAAFVGPEQQEDNNSISEVKSEKNEDVTKPSIIASGPVGKRSHKIAIASAACVAVIIGSIFSIIIISNSNKDSGPVVGIADLTDEQKEKLGVEKEEDGAVEDSGIEDRNNYSEEYKKYLELSDEEKADLEVVPRKEEIPDGRIDEIKKETDDAIMSSLPEKFDLRDVIDITVGDQGETGLCWDYASSTALETHLKLRGINYNPSESQIDLLSSNLMYGIRNLHGGGTFQYFTDIASSIGTISEDKFASLGINSDISLDEGGINLEYFNLARNDDPFYVTKTVDFPALYKEYGVPVDKTDEEVKEFRNLVKAHIMTNGSLYAVSASPWGWGLPRYCEKAMDACRADHAMSIIGWDDTYPKEKFGKVNANGNNTGETPVHDGAYLVLNSWGEDWDGSDAKNGVFYISYDEYNIESQLSGVVSTSLDDTKEVDSFTSEIVRDTIKDKLSFYIIEKDEKEYISDYALDRVSFLDLPSRGLTNNDLEDVTEAFSNVSSLMIRDNNISDLSSLANLNNLNGIYFSGNNVEDISVLCSIDKISGLDLSYNRIADVSCLEGRLGDNAYLDVSGNMGVTGFEKITNLRGLGADGIGLESLESLNGLSRLTSLSVRNNNIKNLKGLNTVEEAFYSLDLSGNKELVDLTFDKPVSNLTIGDSALTDISILNTIEADVVHASGNNFGDLSGLKNDKIMHLDLSGSKNLSNLSSLNTVKHLNLSNCGIASLSEIDELSGIESLILDDNEIRALDGIEKLENLVYLNISNNQISSLNGLSKLPKLSNILADNNLISDASELRDLTGLYFLSLNNNKLSSVPDFKGQDNLFLALENNPIENVVIPKTVAAINLKDCGANSIDYSRAEKLRSISLMGNPGWNKYRDLISALILKQQELGGDPYISISTDYNFSKEDLESLGNISGLPDGANWRVTLREYVDNLKKSSDGVVNLQDYPGERAMFISFLKSGINQDGFTVDRAATKLTLSDATTESLSLDRRVSVNGNAHLFADSITFNFNE